MSDDPAFRHTNGYVGWCDSCSKKGFVSRKAARRAGKKTGNGIGMHAYRCPVSDLWHTGHLAEPVRQGLRTKDEVYKRGAC